MRSSDKAEAARLSHAPMIEAKLSGTVVLDGERVTVKAGVTRCAPDLLARNPDALKMFDVSALAPSLHTLSVRRSPLPRARRRTSRPSPRAGAQPIPRLSSVSPPQRLPRLPGGTN